MVWSVRSTLAVFCFILTDKLASQPAMPFKSLESMYECYMKKPLQSFCLLFTVVFGIYVLCIYTPVCVPCAGQTFLVWR